MKAAPEWVEGIVLRLVNYGESDRIVGVLTRSHGKISAFAPGARRSRKRFGGALDLFAHLRMQIHPPRSSAGSLWRLSSIDLIDAYLCLRGDLRILAEASYMSECLNTLAGEGDPNPRLYEWWKGVLTRMDRGEVSPSEMTRYELELLAMCGYAPRWNHCEECGTYPRGARLFFSFERGGVTCERCRKRGEGRWIEESLVKAVLEGSSLPEAKQEMLRRTVDAFVMHTLGHEPKSRRFREEAFRGRG